MSRRTGFINVLTVVFALATIGLIFFGIYKEMRVWQMPGEVAGLREQVAQLIKDQASNKQQVADACVQQAGDAVVKTSSAQVWRDVQDKAHNAVVQIFSQIAELDLLQPYKTPAQYPAYGSGFFIDEQGYVVTNAHVVNQAKSVWIQMPCFGKRIIDVEIVGVSPERDIALLKVNPTDLGLIKNTLGKVPFVPLGNSDKVRRADEVLAVGYPLGQQSLKSTTGVISGREQHLIQMSAPINPGNSGGPLLNNVGEVIGINTANVPTAQNVGYIIPINDLKIILDDLRAMKLVRKPFLGVLFNNSTDTLTQYLGNPLPGGCYIVEVVENSTLFRAGVQRGDMLYEINGNRLDLYGEMTVPWSEDKISLIDYVHRLAVGDDIKLVFYRNGKRKEVTVQFGQNELPFVHRVYPGYQEIDYEVFGGMVVMQLTMNHVQALASNAPGLAKFAELKNQKEPILLVTHIFPNSHLARARTVSMGSTINEVNGKKVTTLEQFRSVMKDAAKSEYLVLKVSDNVARASDNVLVALPFAKLLDQEQQLSRDFHYPLSALAQDLLKARAVVPKL